MDQVKQILLEFSVRYGFQVAGALIILIVGVLVARTLGSILGEWLEKRKLEPPVRLLFVRLARLLTFSVAVVIALSKFGVDVLPLIAGLSIAGVGVGLALQGVLSNLFAGLLIIVTKPFRVGEYVELLGVEGQVRQIELFSTTLVHPDKSRIVIPNRRIIGEVLHNFGEIRQLALSVYVTPSADVDKALGAIRRAVAANPRVLKAHEPVIGVNKVENGAIGIGVAPWVAIADYGAAPAEIHKAIIEQFRAEGIAGPVPLREIRMLQAQGT
jgi:small conductance mechanosensitive channel